MFCSLSANPGSDAEGCSVSGPLKRTSGRVYLLTWYKAGSQWVRDLLTHPRIAAASGLVNSGITFDSANSPIWPALPEGSFAGPVYTAGPADWDRNARPGDRAVVLLRELRDITVSMMYSLTLSHTPNPVTDQIRSGLLRLSEEDRLLVSMSRFRSCKNFADWGEQGRGQSGNVWITTYEQLIADTVGELASISAFLNWRLSRDDLDAVATNLSFQTRSGRERGDENPFSHYRKGIAGDWKSHFNRRMALIFDLSTGGQLVRSGYESDRNWYDRCPDTCGTVLGPGTTTPLLESAQLQAELVRLQEQNRWLRQKLEACKAA